MKPEELSIKHFSYTLPEEKIAHFPLQKRDESKLLVFENASISETKFSCLPQVLAKGDFLVFNQTRVVHARIFFYTESGAKVELFCLHPSGIKPIALALQDELESNWTCLVGNARKWKKDHILELHIPDMNLALRAEMQESNGNGYEIKFTWDRPVAFAEVLDKAGQLPIPPYLKRNSEPSDEQRYQTVYAVNEGSVAAPTAGLHFTEKVLEDLKLNGVFSGFLTLHVGAGTFKPVKSETMAGHQMHAEEFSISYELLERLIATKGRIIPVGTTSLRTLESIYWIGIQVMKRGELNESAEIGQWEPYQEYEELPDRNIVFSSLLKQMKFQDMQEIKGRTEILIAPGYHFRVCEGIVTNFHQPESTLLLLISALIGERWKEVYAYALNHEFRFLSYGDSSILLP